MSAVSKEIVEAFAWAVAEPGETAMIINELNEKSRFCSLDEAIASDHSFAVKVRSSMLAGDFDQPDGIERARAASEQLSAMGLRPVSLASGQPGRAHVWALANGSDRVAARSLLRERGADLREGTKLIRPPMSPHRLGLEPKLIAPSCMQDALDLLRNELPAEAVFWVKAGWQRGRRSNRLVSLALLYLQAGRSPNEFIQDVLSNPGGAGGKVAHRRDKKQYVERTFAKAVSLWRAGWTFEDNIDAYLGKVQEAADQFAWPPRNSQLQVTLTALIELARSAGKVVLFASVRDVSELAGLCSITTASRHLRRLRKLGWLRLVKAGAGTEASQFEITTPTVAQSDTLSSTSPPSVDTRVFLDSHISEALRGRPVQRRVLGFIPQCGITVPALARASNLSCRSCRNAVQGLVALGLVQLKNRTFYPTISAESIKDAARLRGTLGDAARRAERHTIERENWRILLAHAPSLPKQARRRRKSA